MKRSTFARPSFQPGVYSTFKPPTLENGKPDYSKGLARSRMRRRPTRPKLGSEPKRRAWLRTLACACCGRPAPSEVSHERRKGTGLALRAADVRAWPSCRRCHLDYAARRGFFAMPDEARAAWTDLTCALLGEAYMRTFGSEPELREKIAKGRAA